MKIYIWGTGRIAGKVIGNYIDLSAVEGFIDNDKNKKEYMGKRVVTPDRLIDIEFDAVLVANLYSKKIYIQCKDLGIDLKKIIFLYQNCLMQDLNTNYNFVKSVLGEKISDIVKNRYQIIRGVEAQEKLCLWEWEKKDNYQENDYVRMKCFELAVKEIRKRNIAGAVAEAGVFRGEFAQFINYAFPDKDIYLFDTFDGFNANEALDEVNNGNCTNAFVEAYKQTNKEIVLSKMKYAERVILKEGIFPESLNGLEENFVFVSLDMDFEDSIYAGLEYFYPRLLEGGYMFVHDYTSSLRGVEKAVDRYEKNKGIKICKVPLCDANGTLVITK